MDSLRYTYGSGVMVAAGGSVGGVLTVATPAAEVYLADGAAGPLDVTVITLVLPTTFRGLKTRIEMMNFRSGCICLLLPT